MKIALVQQVCSRKPSKNLAKSITGIKLAASRNADLVILPELHTHSYFCKSVDPENFNLAEPIPGPTSTLLAQAARRYNIVIVASIFERRTAGIYHNTAVVLDSDGSHAGIYRKMHIPDDPGYYEKYYFTMGDLGFKPITTSIGKLGVMVCWDQWFPEAARLMTLAGAQLLIYPSAIGWEPTDSNDEKQRQLQSWLTIQCSHAIANGLHVVCCNRIGTETNGNVTIDFWGNSFIAGPQGEMLAHADATTRSVILSKIELEFTEELRKSWPFLRDRRTDAYHDVTKRYLD
ncbi:MAG TPA: carbon-nitrogen hydrolase [Crenotrichaceae bacterium]|nr:carbon-nitrogen hydrolase [Crenotrichaceae bacterium]